jgi:hypothetical protein
MTDDLWMDYQAIGDRWGVAKETVRQWRKRYDSFPEPGMVAGSSNNAVPLWRQDVMDEWVTGHRSKM